MCEDNGRSMMCKWLFVMHIKIQVKQYVDKVQYYHDVTGIHLLMNSYHITLTRLPNLTRCSPNFLSFYSTSSVSLMSAPLIYLFLTSLLQLHLHVFTTLCVSNYLALIFVLVNNVCKKSVLYKFKGPA